MLDRQMKPDRLIDTSAFTEVEAYLKVQEQREIKSNKTNKERKKYILQ